MLILAAVVAIFVYGMMAAMLGTILPELSERFHLTPSQNGTIAFAQALGLVIASLAVGPLLDNEGKRRASSSDLPSSPLRFTCCLVRAAIEPSSFFSLCLGLAAELSSPAPTPLPAT